MSRILIGPDGEGAILRALLIAIIGHQDDCKSWDGGRTIHVSTKDSLYVIKVDGEVLDVDIFIDVSYKELIVLIKHLLPEAKVWADINVFDTFPQQ